MWDYYADRAYLSYLSLSVISLIILSSVLLSGCASTLGGSTSPEDLLTKDVSGKYTTKNEMIEVFDCLTRWVGTKMPFALRREITSDGAQGHLFWKPDRA